MLAKTDLNIASSLINRYNAIVIIIIIIIITINIIITIIISIIIIITNFWNTHNTMQV